MMNGMDDASDDDQAWPDALHSADPSALLVAPVPGEGVPWVKRRDHSHRTGLLEARLTELCGHADRLWDRYARAGDGRGADGKRACFVPGSERARALFAELHESMGMLAKKWRGKGDSPHMCKRRWSDLMPIYLRLIVELSHTFSKAGAASGGDDGGSGNDNASGAHVGPGDVIEVEQRAMARIEPARVLNAVLHCEFSTEAFQRAHLRTYRMRFDATSGSGIVYAACYVTSDDWTERAYCPTAAEAVADGGAGDALFSSSTEPSMALVRSRTSGAAAGSDEPLLYAHCAPEGTFLHTHTLALGSPALALALDGGASPTRTRDDHEAPSPRVRKVRCRVMSTSADSILRTATVLVGGGDDDDDGGGGGGGDDDGGQRPHKRPRHATPGDASDHVAAAASTTSGDDAPPPPDATVVPLQPRRPGSMRSADTDQYGAAIDDCYTFPYAYANEPSLPALDRRGAWAASDGAEAKRYFDRLVDEPALMRRHLARFDKKARLACRSVTELDIVPVAIERRGAQFHIALGWRRDRAHETSTFPGLLCEDAAVTHRAAHVPKMVMHAYELRAEQKPVGAAEPCRFGRGMLNHRPLTRAELRAAEADAAAEAARNAQDAAEDASPDVAEQYAAAAAAAHAKAEAAKARAAAAAAAVATAAADGADGDGDADDNDVGDAGDAADIGNHTNDDTGARTDQYGVSFTGFVAFSHCYIEAALPPHPDEYKGSGRRIGMWRTPGATAGDARIACRYFHRLCNEPALMARHLEALVQRGECTPEQARKLVPLAIKRQSKYYTIVLPRKPEPKRHELASHPLLIYRHSGAPYLATHVPRAVLRAYETRREQARATRRPLQSFALKGGRPLTRAELRAAKAALAAADAVAAAATGVRGGAAGAASAIAH